MYITRVDRGYKPLVFKNNYNLNKFLEEKTILNLSKRVLSNEEVETLALGLTYCTHTVPNTQKKLRKQEMDDYSIQIDTMVHLAVNQNTSTKSGFISHLCQKIWCPPKKKWRANKKIKRLQEDYRLMRQLSPNKDNKYQASKLGKILLHLKKDPSINITIADKGGCTVIWPDDQYRLEALTQLSDASVYKELTKDELTSALEALKTKRDIISKALLDSNIISWREFKAFTVGRAEPSPLYLLPKRHKNQEPTPGRPIVAAYNSTLHFIDKLITEITKPLLQLILGSLTDTKDLLNQLDKITITPSSKIVTADVTSLYPKIPWKEGINASTQHYNHNLEFLSNHFKNKKSTLLPSTSQFQELLALVTKNSYIHFRNEKFYHQISGTSMGVAIAVYFANCFMMTLTWDHISRPLPTVQLFLRFIDDLLIITESTLDYLLVHFFAPISTEEIKYTLSDLDTKAVFLDLCITIDPNSLTLITSPYSKPTATPFFLHSSSNHPPSTIKSIPTAQLIRIKRNSSTDEIFQIHAKRMIKAFGLRGYCQKHLKECLAKVNLISRSSLLTNKPNSTLSQKIGRSIKIIRPFNSAYNWTDAKKIVNQLHNKIKSYYNDSCINQIFEETCSTIIFSSEKNSRSYFSSDIKSGTNKTTNGHSHAQLLENLSYST